MPKGNATKEYIESLQLKPGQVVYKCPKCCSIKPDRAHHCRYGADAAVGAKFKIKFGPACIPAVGGFIQKHLNLNVLSCPPLYLPAVFVNAAYGRWTTIVPGSITVLGRTTKNTLCFSQ